MEAPAVRGADSEGAAAQHAHAALPDEQNTCCCSVNKMPLCAGRARWSPLRPPGHCPWHARWRRPRLRPSLTLATQLLQQRCECTGVELLQRGRDCIRHWLPRRRGCDEAGGCRAQAGWQVGGGRFKFKRGWQSVVTQASVCRDNTRDAPPPLVYSRLLLCLHPSGSPSPQAAGLPHLSRSSTEVTGRRGSGPMPGGPAARPLRPGGPPPPPPNAPSVWTPTPPLSGSSCGGARPRCGKLPVWKLPP